MRGIMYRRGPRLRRERARVVALTSKTRVAAKLLCALLMLFLAESAAAQQAGAVTGEGTDAFRLMLKMAGLRPVTSLEEILDHPTN